MAKATKVQVEKDLAAFDAALNQATEGLEAQGRVGVMITEATAKLFSDVEDNAAAELVRNRVEMRAAAFINTNGARPAGKTTDVEVMAWANAFKNHVNNPVRSVNKVLEEKVARKLTCRQDGVVTLTVVSTTADKTDEEKALARCLAAIKKCEQSSRVRDIITGTMLAHFAGV